MISIERYAELCVLMSDTGGDQARELAIVNEQGIDILEWKKAKADFTTRMSDPADMGKTALEFMPLYQAALDRKRSPK